MNTTNFSIPKGTSVAIPVFGLHRDSNIFPDPEKFDPERFSEENIKTRHSYVYLPFGEGPRICIGKYIFIYIKLYIYMCVNILFYFNNLYFSKLNNNSIFYIFAYNNSNIFFVIIAD